jgi:DNA-binding NarL/FixJ family response regulator
VIFPRSVPSSRDHAVSVPLPYRQQSIEQLADLCFRRTAEHHVQHVYTKIGVSSRAAAALFTLEHDVLASPATSKSAAAD